MDFKLTKVSFMLVALLAVAAATYRITTAPQRMEERRATARSVCTNAGGEWVKQGREEWCLKVQAASR